jgi:predicted dehydrogenase
MSEAKPIVFGIIGCGGAADVHARAILQCHKNAKLKAIYGTNREKTTNMANKYGCIAANSLEEILNDKEITAVTVATPHGAHLEPVCAAAKAGKHILCEKPLEITCERIKEMIKCCQENKVVLSCVCQSRFYDVTQLLKKTCDEGRFGKMLLSSIQMRWYRPEEYFSKSSWHGFWELDGGGVLINQASHAIDNLVYINGVAEEVFGFSKILTHNIEVEDNICAVIKYANGSMGTIEASTSCEPGFPRRMEFSGTNGSVTIEDDKITRWEFKDSRPEDDEIKKKFGGPVVSIGASTATVADATYHAKQIEELVSAIRFGTKVSMDGAESLKVVELICGIYESCRTNKPYIFK